MPLSFNTQIPLLRFEDEQYAPSSLVYQDGKPALISDLSKVNDGSVIFNDFKIQLGKKKAKNASRKINASRGERTNLGIAKDFFELVLGKLNEELCLQGRVLPEKILIAEPLSLSSNEKIDDEWLKTYRESISQILPKFEGGKLHPFKVIDFLPEPFAVYQYYRYGNRNAIVSQHKKHIAFVTDFGGGTFDCSVVVTTKTGDISQTGRNARALGAHSIPVGGFFINRVIAERILSEVQSDKKAKAQIKRSLKHYDQFRNDPDETNSEAYSDKNVVFFKHFERLLQDVEAAKIFLVSQIADWSLDAVLTPMPTTHVALPIDIYSHSSASRKFSIDANFLREIFVAEIWDKKLKNAVSVALSRSKNDLGGQEFSVVLLSGGSSNLQWIKSLIQRDFSDQFDGAHILGLHGKFQEIVAKGLAIECARRHYSKGDGDFRATTYNTLCLALGPNDQEPEVRPFKLTQPTRERGQENGVLLRSSTDLRNALDTPFRWSVSLSNAPTRSLSYYFMRSTMDYNDNEARLNFVESKIHRKSNARSGNAVEVELSFSQDMTVRPKFIFYSNKATGEEHYQEGEPFCLDSTFISKQATHCNSYLGFDFGTSTTAVAYIDAGDIEQYEDRSNSSEWMQIEDLINELPYMVSHALRDYASAKDGVPIETEARNAAEAALSLIFAVLYAEHLTLFKGRSAIFKDLAKSSAGPLWGAIKKLVKAIGNKANFSKPLCDFINSKQNIELMDQMVVSIAAAKHNSVVEGVDYNRSLTTIGNALKAQFSEFKLGYFENCEPDDFIEGEYRGTFRITDGYNPPFPNHLNFQGNKSFSKRRLFLVDIKSGNLLELSPYLMNGLDTIAQGNGLEIHTYDKSSKDGVFYKGVQKTKHLDVGSDSKTMPVADQIRKMLECDVEKPVIKGQRFLVRGE